MAASTGRFLQKTAGVPHKFSEEKQQQFIDVYEYLKKTAGDEPILFIDAVHPTQAIKLSYGWIQKGHKKLVKTTGSRTGQGHERFINNSERFDMQTEL